jgi:hypothetical protein
MKAQPTAIRALAQVYAAAVVDDLFRPHWAFRAKPVKRFGKRKPAFYSLDFIKETQS